MKTNKWTALAAAIWTLAITAAAGPTPEARAQGSSGVGGGKFSEAEIAIFYGRLQDYFAGDEWQAVFPEVTRYNETHDPDFIDLMRSVTFKIVNRELDFNGEERDCVPMIDGSTRWIECNGATIPENTLDNQPTLYSFLLHEIFVYAGIETAKGRWLPSTYEVSWRMADQANLSLVVQKVWMPGKKDRKPTVSELGLVCYSESLGRIHWDQKRATVFVWQPDGNWVLFEHFVPSVQAHYGYQQIQVRTKGEWNRLRLGHSIARTLGRQVSSRVIATGRTQINDSAGNAYSVISNDNGAFGDNSRFHLSVRFSFRIGQYARDWSGETPNEFTAELLYGKGWYRNERQVACKPYTEWDLDDRFPVKDLMTAKPGQVIRQQIIPTMGKWKDSRP